MTTDENGHGALISLCSELSYAKWVVLLTFLWELGSPKARSQWVMTRCSFAAVPFKGGSAAGEIPVFSTPCAGLAEHTWRIPYRGMEEACEIVEKIVSMGSDLKLAPRDSFWTL